MKDKEKVIHALIAGLQLALGTQDNNDCNDPPFRTASQSCQLSSNGLNVPCFCVKALFYAQTRAHLFCTDDTYHSVKISMRDTSFLHLCDPKNCRTTI